MLVLVLGATAFARAHEDPRSVLTAGASREASATGGGAPEAATRDPQAGTDSGPAAGAAARAPGGPAPGAAPAPAGATPTASAATSAAPHADAGTEEGLLPDEGAAGQTPVPVAGWGTIRVLPVAAMPVRTPGRTVRFSVEIEDGLPVNTSEYASAVRSVLADERGWWSQDEITFVPVSPTQEAAGEPVDIRVTLASPSLTAKLCAPLDVSQQQVSCWNGGRSVLNLTRWLRGARTYGDDLAGYRTYLVNHEVGHGLGHQHERCPAPGQPAPVMVQQTKSLDGCTAWPYPVRT